LLKNKQSVVVF